MTAFYVARIKWPLWSQQALYNLINIKLFHIEYSCFFLLWWCNSMSEQKMSVVPLILDMGGDWGRYRPASFQMDVGFSDQHLFQVYNYHLKKLFSPSCLRFRFLFMAESCETHASHAVVANPSQGSHAPRCFSVPHGCTEDYLIFSITFFFFFFNLIPVWM